MLTFHRKDAFKLRTKRSGFEFEQHLAWLLAAKAWGVTPGQFESMSVREQALMIATYMAENQMEALMAEETRRKAEGRNGPGEGHNLNNNRRGGNAKGRRN